jgi:hypothetical protein
MGERAGLEALQRGDRSYGITVKSIKFLPREFECTVTVMLTLIDGQNLLALLTKHGYNFRIEGQN